MIGLRIIALVAVAVACIVALRAKSRRSHAVSDPGRSRRRVDEDARAVESWEDEGGAVQGVARSGAE